MPRDASSSSMNRPRASSPTTPANATRRPSRAAPQAKIADELQHVVAQRRSERGERLVEQENGPLPHQRARDRDTLALAARQLARKPPLEAGEPDSAKRSG